MNQQNILLVTFTVLIIVSLIVRDCEFIVKKPYLFVGETILIGLLAALQVYVLYTSRGAVKKKFIILFIEFAALHVFFQLSGFYNFIFKYIKIH